MPGFHSFSFPLTTAENSTVFSIHIQRIFIHTTEELPYYSSVPKSVHTPGTNRDPRSCWLLWQHQGQKNAKQEQRILSRRKWAPSSGRPHLTFGAIIKCGNMIEKQNWDVSCCHGNQWSHISLDRTSPTSPFNCGILIYLFSYMIIS